MPRARHTRGAVGLGGVDDPTVAQIDDPVGPGGVPCLVGDEQPGRARVAAGPQHREHALEVQLPFLQTVVPDALLAPFVVGDAPATAVASLLDAVWDDPGTVVVISTDLSHYHPYDEAVRLDRHTAGEILARHPDGVSDTDACGNRPLRGLLRVADERHLQVELLDLRNSGDTAGDRQRVVGYGAFALC